MPSNSTLMQLPTTCSGCPLETRPRLPGGDGDPTTATIVLIGEAPGANEILLGKPFVGKSGQLLKQTLQAIDPTVLSRAYITNTCLCRPAGNATPPAAAIANCLDRLDAEIQSVTHRKVIITLGATALSQFSTESITVAHGIPFWSDHFSCYVMPLIHPAAILRTPALFRDFAADLEFALTSIPDHHIINDERLFPQVHVMSKETFDDAWVKLLSCEYLVCDIETTGLDPIADRILSVMVLGDEHNAYVIPNELMPEAKQFFEDRNVAWVGHNASQFDAKFLKTKFGIDWYPGFDTLLAHYCLDEEQSGHGLKTLARKFFFADDYGTEMKAHMKAGTLEQADQKLLYRYQSLDCLYTFKLVPLLYKRMELEDVTRVHDDILIPLSHAFRDIELRGIKVDEAYLHTLQGSLSNDLALNLMEIREEADKFGMEQFNPNSPKQVIELLYDRMKLPGERVTDRTTLSTMINIPVVKLILDYRTTSKLLSTYVGGLLEKKDAEDRIHADFLLFGTQTGRLSCHNPNLHNIPTLMGPIIKKAFIPQNDNWWIVNADYSQLELRIATWYSNDPKLIQTYKNNKDLHRIIASELFGIPEDQVTYKQRYTAKYVDFGILYGRGAKSLTGGWSAGASLTPDEKDLVANWTVEIAQHYIDTLFERFPGLADWIRHQKEFAKSHHYAVTPVGRRRRFPLILPETEGEVLRQAVNAPIQSLASDICQAGLIRLTRELDPTKAFIVSTVHDSIMFEVRKDALEEIVAQIHATMETWPYGLEPRLPLRADVEYGPNWGEMKEIEK